MSSRVSIEPGAGKEPGYVSPASIQDAIDTDDGQALVDLWKADRTVFLSGPPMPTNGDTWLHVAVRESDHLGECAESITFFVKVVRLGETKNAEGLTAEELASKQGKGDIANRLLFLEATTASAAPRDIRDAAVGDGLWNGEYTSAVVAQPVNASVYGTITAGARGGGRGRKAKADEDKNVEDWRKEYGTAGVDATLTRIAALLAVLSLSEGALSAYASADPGYWSLALIGGVLGVVAICTSHWIPAFLAGAVLLVTSVVLAQIVATGSTGLLLIAGLLPCMFNVVFWLWYSVALKTGTIPGALLWIMVGGRREVSVTTEAALALAGGGELLSRSKSPPYLVPFQVVCAGMIAVGISTVAFGPLNFAYAIAGGFGLWGAQKRRPDLVRYAFAFLVFWTAYLVLYYVLLLSSDVSVYCDGLNDAGDPEAETTDPALCEALVTILLFVTLVVLTSLCVFFATFASNLFLYNLARERANGAPPVPSPPPMDETTALVAGNGPEKI